jgi:hypothetical protein
MAEANTLAYYDTATITAVKGFRVQAPVVYLKLLTVTKLRIFVIS